MVTRRYPNSEENTASWGTISSLSWADMWIPRDRREMREVGEPKIEAWEVVAMMVQSEPYKVGISI